MMWSEMTDWEPEVSTGACFSRKSSDKHRRNPLNLGGRESR